METMQCHITKMGLVLRYIIILHLSGINEPIGINKKCSKGFNVGLIIP